MKRVHEYLKSRLFDFFTNLFSKDKIKNVDILRELKFLALPGLWWETSRNARLGA
jgi:hypothetical protein